VLTLAVYGTVPADGQSGAEPSTQMNVVEEMVAEEGSTNGDVVIDGQKFLTVYQAIGSYTVQERAARIKERILAVAKDRKTPPDSVIPVPRDSWTEISTGNKILLIVTDEDAKLAGKPRAQLAAEDTQSIREGLENYRRNHNFRAILGDIGLTILATLVLVPVAWIVRKVRLAVRVRLKRWVQKQKSDEEKKTALNVAVTYAVQLVLALGSMLQWLILIAIFNVYLTVVLSFFPQTQSVSHAVAGWTFQTLRNLGKAILLYLPNLIVIAVVAVVALQVFRLITLVFSEISKGNLSINGFYPEWAEPTARLIRALVFALVMVIIFPYLPGSKSPAFQGISIFAGILLSIGSSSAVANVIAGAILTYMRALSVGDWVKIGDVVGEVEEKSLLVTRILTQKQETITIPNATVMNGSVTNYTREAKITGVIFHTNVTIGYDAPWRQVHQLLMDAALDTKNVLHAPAPFVLQNALNDFYVAYELNAYTDVPRNMQYIYSDLHQNIQDRFNAAGVEICSPHFAALRDGNTNAMPANHIRPAAVPRAFRVNVEDKEAKQTTSNAK
jgi:small-conductance mechanosensitive channel